jgi:hypothetical protein
MANFIEYASKAQSELNVELQKLSEKENELSLKSSAQFAREAQLDAREAEVAASEKEIQQKREDMTMWESKKKREEEAQAMYDAAILKETDSVKRLKEAKEALSEAELKLQELSKRELLLVERTKSYQEEIKSEIMARFLGVK